VVGRPGVPPEGAAALAQRAWVLHERHALTLDRVRDQLLPRIALGAEVRERACERVVVLPVALRDVPAERTQLRLEIPECDDLLGRLVGLELVAVDDDPEVALRV